MIDLYNYNKALKISWMKRALLDNACVHCTSLSEHECNIILNTGGRINGRIIKTLNPFWKEVAQYWNEFLSKLENPSNIKDILFQSPWNNSFLINKESFSDT